MYPKVEDDATIILEYENATGIIEASWNWPYSIKDFRVYGSDKSYHAVNENTLIENKTHTGSKHVELTEDYY